MSAFRPLCYAFAFALLAALGVVSAGEVFTPAQTQSTPPAPLPPATKMSGDNDAEKHARRTACLKDARARRLVGAQRTAFVRNCLDT